MINLTLIKDDLVQSKSNDNYTKAKWIVLIIIFLNSMLFSLVVSFTTEPENIAIQYLCGIPIYLMTFIWCHLNAYSHGYRIGFQLKLLLLLFFYVGFPIYLFQIGGFKSFLKAIYFILILIFCAIIMVMLTSTILGG